MTEKFLLAASSRTVSHQSMRALNPYKIHALTHILVKHSTDRIIVFCDTVRVVEILHDTLLHGRSMLLNGSSPQTIRDKTLETFAETAPGTFVLLCTKVCDASIDFPLGCVIVEFHLCSGSRQQEVQRCGRGTRGTKGATIYHIVNAGTEEVVFSDRRTSHLVQEMWGTVHIGRTKLHVETSQPTPEDYVPLNYLGRIKITKPTVSKYRTKTHRLKLLHDKR
jgi:superfamily II DNA/RNA helicase